MCKIKDILNLIGLDIRRFPVDYSGRRRMSVNVELDGGSLTLCSYVSSLVNRRTSVMPRWITFTESGSIIINVPANQTRKFSYVITRNIKSFRVTINDEVIAQYPEDEEEE